MKYPLPIFLLCAFTILQAQGLSEVSSWAYQLQNINVDEISSSNDFDLVVIDYSRDGTDEGKFTASEVSRMKQGGKKVISYISIGEAESYRFYWNDSWDADEDGEPDVGAPSWLGSVNPDWEGNYKVRFWEPEWQQIIFSYVDKIIDQGFDGIYCDIIDAYYYWSEETGEYAGADTSMISFINSIREYVKLNHEGDFYIIPQNGEYIIEEINVTDYYRTQYLNSIDAIGVEDVFCYGDAEENNPFNPDDDRIRVLKDYSEWGIKVLSVEYLTDQNLIEQFVEAAVNSSFVPYVTVRELDRLTGQPTSIPEQQIVPGEFALNQNYPNPFNPTTTIKYELPVKGIVTIKVYDVLGKEVTTLVKEMKNTGSYEVIFNSDLINRRLASGIYIYKINFKPTDNSYRDYTLVRKMLLMK